MRIGDHTAQEIVDDEMLEFDIWIFLGNCFADFQKQTVGHGQHIVFAGDSDFTLLTALARQFKGKTNDPFGSGFCDGFDGVFARPKIAKVGPGVSGVEIQSCQILGVTLKAQIEVL